MNNISKILVPVDFSDCSRAALAQALSLGAVLGAKIEVLHVAEVPSFSAEPRVTSAGASKTLREFGLDTGQAELDAFLGKLEAKDREKLVTKVDAGRPRDCILERAKRDRFDLIVMGTHGRTGRVHSLVGSVAESVVRMAPCPVLTVRAEA